MNAPSQWQTVAKHLGLRPEPDPRLAMAHIHRECDSREGPMYRLDLTAIYSSWYKPSSRLQPSGTNRSLPKAKLSTNILPAVCHTGVSEPEFGLRLTHPSLIHAPSEPN